LFFGQDQGGNLEFRSNLFPPRLVFLANNQRPLRWGNAPPMSKQPLYVSQRTARGLWQQYRVYADRIELPSIAFFHTMVISFEDIEKIEVIGPLVREIFKRGPRLGVKLDIADFNKHVALRKKSGIMRDFHFTPDDPEAFIAAFQSAREAHQARQQRVKSVL
jgi:hypothetical protein